MNKITPFAFAKNMFSNHRRTLIFSIMLGVISLVASLILMFLSGYVLSATAVPHAIIFSLMIPIAIIQIAGIVRPFANYIERLKNHDWILKITSLLQRTAFRNSAQLINDPKNTNPLGDYNQLIADTITKLQNYIIRALLPLVIAYLLCILVTLLTTSFSLTLTGILAASFIINIVLIPYALHLGCKASISHFTLIHQHESVSLIDHLQGIRDIQLAHREKELYEAHTKTYRRMINYRQKITTYRAIAQFASSIFLSATLIVILILVSTYEGTSYEYNNYVAAFSLAWISLVELLLVVPSLFIEKTQHEQALTNLDLLMKKDEVVQLPQNELNTAFEEKTKSSNNALEMHNVIYTYPHQNHPALTIDSLCIKRGEHVLVLGESGSGKTTFAKVLTSALACESGSIYLNGRSSVSHKKGKQSAFGYLDQDPYLFNRTLRANLTLGIYDKSDEELIEVLESVGLKDRFLQLKDGLDTIIGETGESFSSGEAHRIAFARILIQDPDMLIIDEPFCALDTNTEEKLLDLLCNLYQEKTIILITHHLSHVEKFDRALFFHNGSLFINDTIENLTTTNEHFMKLKHFDR